MSRALPVAQAMGAAEEGVEAVAVDAWAAEGAAACLALLSSRLQILHLGGKWKVLW